MILGILSLIATDLAGIAFPWLVKDGIDTALSAGADRSLLQYPLLILAAASLQGFFRYCWRINIHGFSRRCEAELRDCVFTHLQKLPLSYFQYTKTGDLMSRLTNDIHAVRELMGFGSLAIVDGSLTVSNEPGLGYRYDWAELDANALTKVEVRERLTPPSKLVSWH